MMSFNSASKETTITSGIRIVNKSKLLCEEDFDDMVAACALQLKEHVAPMWRRLPWEITTCQNNNDVVREIVITDSSNQEGSLGYHTQTSEDKICGYVFVNPILNSGGAMLTGGWLSVSTILSHEIIETFINPEINLWAKLSDNVSVACEVCDPVEMDSYEVLVRSKRSVCVSNFVLPEWFNSTTVSKDRFDFMSKVKHPLSLSRGGYMVTYDSSICQTQTVYGPDTAEIRRKMRQDRHNRNNFDKSISHVIESY